MAARPRGESEKHSGFAPFLLLYHDLGKVCDSSELPADRAQERVSVSLQVLLRAVHQHIHEETVERRRDRGDRFQGLPVSARGDELLEQSFRLEKVEGERQLGILAIEVWRRLSELFGSQDVADALEGE